MYETNGFLQEVFLSKIKDEGEKRKFKNDVYLGEQDTSFKVDIENLFNGTDISRGTNVHSEIVRIHNAHDTLQKKRHFERN